MELTPQQRAQAQEVFKAKGQCPDCGGIHARACPRVKRHRIKYAESRPGQIPQVIEYETEYFEAGTWPETGVVWPDDAYEEDGELAIGPAAIAGQKEEDHE